MKVLLFNWFHHDVMFVESTSFGRVDTYEFINQFWIVFSLLQTIVSPPFGGQNGNSPHILEAHVKENKMDV